MPHTAIFARVVAVVVSWFAFDEFCVTVQCALCAMRPKGHYQHESYVSNALSKAVEGRGKERRRQGKICVWQVPGRNSIIEAQACRGTVKTHKIPHKVLVTQRKREEEWKEGVKEAEIGGKRGKTRGIDSQK